jgi:hypothetical protein
LNYTWKEDNLKKSVENAGARCLDVYVGVDVFGRNCYGGGGFNSCQVKLDTYVQNLMLTEGDWKAARHGILIPDFVS